MSFDTSWDVEKYKTEHETDDHWEFKKSFLSTHKNKYPEHRLVSLAQVFFNIEFLGCIYPNKTMELIERLTEGLADDLRKNRKRKIQRTFVGASDAAEAKAKRISIGLDSVKVKGNNEALINITNNKLLKFNKLCGPDYFLPGFLLLVGNNENAHEILDRSCSFCNISKPVVQFECSEPGSIKANLFIKSKYITNGLGPTEKTARKNATKAAYNILKENCFSIKIKTNEETLKKEDILINGQPSTNNSKPIIPIADNTDNESQIKLNNDNIGSKMLRTMGWKEGVGLGKNEQGRLEPIEVVQLPKKLGLGNTVPANDKNDINDKKLLSELKKEVSRHVMSFMKSPKKKLTFSTGFTKDERKVIHMICLKHGLKTKSYGQNENRYMIISKKQDALEVFEELVQCGYENDDYLLIPPPQKN